MLSFSLKGHDLVMRELQRDDVDKCLEFFNSLSEESIRCRFGHLLAKLTRSTAKQRTATGEDEKAIAIFDHQQTRIVAIGRCYFGPQANTSEIALVVSESHRRCGLGRFILDQLIRIARDRSSGSIHAFIATQNAPVIKLLKSAGFLARSATDENDVELVLPSNRQPKSRGRSKR
jgi:RimJ/RimL family protein N-acetyltransferase